MHDVKLEHRQGLLTMENSCILRQFSTDGAFVPRSFFLKTMSCELLAATQYWFELIVNGQQVSSGTYLSHDFRNMKHRGLEVTIRFVVPVVSFQYQLQMFPASPITRERLMIFPNMDSFCLNYLNGKPHFIFPQYSLLSPVPPGAEEIRLATWNAEQMPDANIHAFPLNRHWGVTDERGLNLSQCDMYHPVFLKFIPGESELRKGPILLGMDQNHRNWILAYEHGSPDNETAKDYLKLGSSYQDHVLKLWISLEKGAFFDGETFTATNPFITPWMNFGTFEASDLDEGRKAFRNYLYDWQSETRSGRKPLIYYNTWGWQRDEENSYLNLSNIKDVRSGHKVYCDATVYDPLPYYHKDADGGPRKFFAPDEVLLDLPRLLQEIDAAYQLGADVFVIDDHNAQGQVIAFSGAVMRYTYHTAPINRDRFLGIIGHAYQLLEDNRLEFNFEFTEPDSVRSAFILGNNTSGLWIKSATCWIKNLFFKSQTTLLVQNGAPGRIILCYPKLKKTPMVNFESRYLNYTIEDTANQRVLHFDIHKADCSIEIEIE